MSGVTHTPGPWEIEEAVKGTTWGIYPAHNRYPCQQPIAQGWASDISERDVSESEANAHLIAAAPELLAALREARDLLASLPADLLELETMAAVDTAHEIGAAIDKAEGGAS